MFDGLNMNSQPGPQMESSYGFREFILGSDPIRFSSLSPQVSVGRKQAQIKEGVCSGHHLPLLGSQSHWLLQPGSDSPYSRASSGSTLPFNCAISLSILRRAVQPGSRAGH